MAKGAPVEALRMDREGTMEKKDKVIDELVMLYQHKADPVFISRKWVEMGAISVLGWLVDTFAELAKNMSINRAAENAAEDRFLHLQASLNRLDLQKVIQCYDLALKNYKLASGNVSYNQQGLLEDFILFWQQVDQTAFGVKL